MTFPHFEGFATGEDTRAIVIAGEIPGYGTVQYCFSYTDLKYVNAIERQPDIKARLDFALGHSGELHPTDFRLKGEPEGVVRPAMVLMLENGDNYTETADGRKTEADSSAELRGKFVADALNGKLVDAIACRPS